MPAKSRCGLMLLLDAGNSRIKWALVRDDAWLHRGALQLGDWPALLRAFTALPPPRRIVASNVAGAEVAAQIRAACAAWDCPVEFIAAQAEQCGVRNGYAQPTQLGSDRWCALLASWHRVKGACLVVSCGTATTVDALSSGGEFLGGLIVPGIDMMRQSLAAGTAQLGSMAGNLNDFPRNTADAMYSGAVRATTGAIRQQYELLNAPGVPCVLSGGAADEVQGRLPMPLLRIDDLVLHGLQVIGQGCEA